MTIVLLVLKIIGILLLALLVLFTALVLLVLFVPVRYRVRGSWREKPELTARVSFLLHAAVLGLDMLPGKNDVYLRILGFKKYLTKADNTEEFEDTIEEIAGEGAVDAAEEAKEAADTFVDTAVREKEKKEGERTTENNAKTGDAGEDAPREDPLHKRRRILSIPHAVVQRIRDFFEQIKAAFGRTRAAFIRFLAVAGRIRRLWENEGNRQALRFLGGRLFLLLRKLAPKKLALDMAYSTGSPDTTGELLGILALFPVAYTQRWNIKPDFTADSFYVDARFDIRGRVFVFQVLGIALSVLLDKNCRKLYNEIKNGS